MLTLCDRVKLFYKLYFTDLKTAVGRLYRDKIFYGDKTTLKECVEKGKSQEIGSDFLSQMTEKTYR